MENAKFLLFECFCRFRFQVQPNIHHIYMEKWNHSFTQTSLDQTWIDAQHTSSWAGQTECCESEWKSLNRKGRSLRVFWYFVCVFSLSIYSNLPNWTFTLFFLIILHSDAIYILNVWTWNLSQPPTVKHTHDRFQLLSCCRAATRLHITVNKNWWIFHENSVSLL